MANNIERLNYYEREHLRSFDFVAEQTYHLEMRRRLNLALHLWGIVDGLDVRKGNIVPGAPDQFFITEGMAIDAYGREIVLFAPYVLSADDLSNNRVGRGTYSLWIAYDRNRSTPPSPGYGICDIKDQYTRLSESFKIVLKPESYANGTEPKVFDALSDDPEKASWLVRLGTLKAEIVNNQLTVTDAKPELRTYIGLRGQRVVAAVANLTPGSNEAKLPITVEADLQETKNLTVGAGFAIDPTKVKPPPGPPTFPNPADFPGPAGNIKANNLFLQDNLYTSVGGEWLALSEYLQRFLPDVLTGIVAINFPGNSPGGGTVNGTLTFSVASTKIKKVGSAKAMAAIASLEWNTRSQLNSIITNPDQLKFKIINVDATPSGAVDNACDVSVQWSVQPTLNDVANFRSAILVATISYVAFCFPAP
jgi:hypothetical protein